MRQSSMNHAGLEQAVELPAVEQLVAEAPVERLDPGVLPRRTGIDEHGGDIVEPTPVGNGVSDELGTIVEPDEPRRATSRGEAVEGGDHGVGVDGAIDDDRRALARVLVDDVEQLEGAAVDGDVELEVHRPQSVRADRAHRPDVGADPGEPLLAALVGHLQAFVTPQAPDPLVVEVPARLAGVLGRPSPPPPWSPPGEVPQELAQSGLVVVDDGRLEALRGAVETNDPAGSTFGHPEPFTQPRGGAALAVRGQKFPSATSRSMSMSSAWLATSFFSRAFSASSSLSRFASLALMPPYCASQRCHVDSATSR